MNCPQDCRWQHETDFGISLIKAGSLCQGWGPLLLCNNVIICTNWANERVCIFSIMWERWTSTVRSLKVNSIAMTLLAFPSITMSITSFSRGDNLAKLVATLLLARLRSCCLSKSLIARFMQSNSSWSRIATRIAQSKIRSSHYFYYRSW